MNEINVNVPLTIKQCPEGHAYAVPSLVAPGFYLCPICAKRILSRQTVDRERLLLNARAERDTARRQIASLKGQITRMKRETH